EDATRAREIVGLVDESIALAYNLVGGLFPARIENEGLASALQEFIHRLSKRHDVRFSIDYPERVNVNTAQATHLFRIAQECVNNAVKHAKPKRVQIRLEETAAAIVLTVQDDGAGIPAGQAAQKGFGLHF